jgi:hypothetical protein
MAGTGYAAASRERFILSAALSSVTGSGRPYGLRTSDCARSARATAPADLALGGGVGTCGVPARVHAPPRAGRRCWSLRLLA